MDREIWRNVERNVERNFVGWVVLVCLIYAVVATTYVANLPLSWDEFQGAKAIDLVRSQVPYAEFRPYKTLLGYYAQLLPLSLSDDPWLALLLVKWFVVAVNTISLGAAALVLGRRFDRIAIVLALLATVVMSTFLERSIELRVDMLTAWPGLFSLLALLSGRPALGGLLAAVSFLVSQKGIYFVAAGGLGLSAAWLVLDRRAIALRAPLVYAASVLVPIGCYVAAFSLVASPRAVIEATFLSSGDVALRELYTDMSRYWYQTLERNPYFWAMGVLGIVVALRPGDAEARRRRLVLASYGAVILACAAWHKQPWPYFFVLLIPTAFVLLTAALEFKPLRGRAGMAVYACVAIVLPLLRVPDQINRDNGYQRLMVGIVSNVLPPDAQYLAGFEMVLGRTHMPGLLSWLDKPRLARLENEIKPVVRQIVDEPPALLIWNSRLRRLPEPLEGYLKANYVKWYGNLRTHSPVVESGTRDFKLQLDGQCEVNANAPILLDGMPLRQGDRLQLPRGQHHSISPLAYQLKCHPVGFDQLPSTYKAQRPLFEHVYTD